MPAVCGELPVACLAEEIETPGDGRIRALITMCGNPASSAPNSERLDKALAQLEFALSFDIYINETSRHADVILPGTPTFEKCYYGAFSAQYAVRNVVRFSPALFKSPEGWVSDWDALLQVSAIASGAGVQDEQGLQAMEDEMIREMLSEAAADEYGVARGIDVDSAMRRLSDKRGVERVIDAGFRVGPYGDGFGANPDGLTLDRIASQPDGVDLGALQPRLPEVLRTPSGKIDMAPATFLEQARALLDTPGQSPARGELLLIGRRQQRSINSWGHNVDILAKGSFRCTLQVHPEDAKRLSLEHRRPASLSTGTGKVETLVEITEDMMPGVVSMPHGWGHNKEDMQLNIARLQPGANYNALTDDMNLDTLSGTAALNAVPVQVAPVQRV
ncbi:MAG: molybdopterin-dependent oxidoreductase [Gammaproteobacteria bacterium]|nr:molybdopterin-dependent oxidoreductase [Gammaproteobacteria bacterium]